MSTDSPRDALRRAIDIVGGQFVLADMLGLNRGSVWPWLNLDGRRVPAEYCPIIERATSGAVRCEELRPDIEWGVLRDATAASAKPSALNA